ncbi:hypothetical protein GCM10010329_84210 [Streptomyces spiroverticillatus]|uniref:YcaO domain-containing protein n=1 Tax=Streptomyces finlayi TaxID=67296 RepID=A0A918X5H8_9ACTN|nr:hypothetical protein [Streptomyces finlayi]GHA49143.1 hypothetical protein GCM10010329_84210 [Streptomyces spiroverticillatus]GHD13700.1 hypothetical protein GCM10010334_72150 [Streptomyces finlayi]
MDTGELTDVRTGAWAPARAAMTEAEARAAFLSRAGGPAVDAHAVRQRAADLLPRSTGWTGAEKGSDPGNEAGADATGETPGLGAVLGVLATSAAEAAIRRVPAGPSGAPAAPPVWGLDLATGALRRVSVPASGRSVPVGVAAGLTWVGALEAGLAQHCEVLIARALGTRATRVPRLRLTQEIQQTRQTQETHGVPGEPVLVPGELLRALHAAGDPAAHDLTDLLSLPACALTLTPHAESSKDVPMSADTVLATGATLTEAARSAVARALTRNGSRADGSSVPDVLAAVRPEQEDHTSRQRPSAQWTRPLDALRSLGHDPVAVLLDHETPVTANGGHPYLVHIVLPTS